MWKKLPIQVSGPDPETKPDSTSSDSTTGGTGNASSGTRVGSTCRPRALREFPSPFALFSIQAFPQAVEDGVIADLGLTIALRIVRSGELAGDLIRRAEVGHLLVGKICHVIEDNGVGESEATHDILPKKLYNLLTSDFGEWHRFDLFGEVVSGYQQKPQLRLRPTPIA